MSIWRLEVRMDVCTPTPCKMVSIYCCDLCPPVGDQLGTGVALECCEHDREGLVCRREPDGARGRAAQRKCGLEQKKEPSLQCSTAEFFECFGRSLPTRAALGTELRTFELNSPRTT